MWYENTYIYYTCWTRFALNLNKIIKLSTLTAKLIMCPFLGMNCTQSNEARLQQFKTEMGVAT